eukprot:gene17609-biopygen14420
MARTWRLRDIRPGKTREVGAEAVPGGGRSDPRRRPKRSQEGCQSGHRRDAEVVPERSRSGAQERSRSGPRRGPIWPQEGAEAVPGGGRSGHRR